MAENLRQLPFPDIDMSNAMDQEKHDTLVRLVTQVLDYKKLNPSADTDSIEYEIDQHVYSLYGLTPEEIAIVEGTAK